MDPVNVSEWATPIVPVIKKDGPLRLCGGFKDTINPVLTADDFFSGLAGGQIFSKIDLCQAYLQMHADQESQ